MTPHGRLTQLYFWSRILDGKEIERFTNDCTTIVNKTGEESQAMFSVLFNGRSTLSPKDREVQFRELHATFPSRFANF